MKSKKNNIDDKEIPGMDLNNKYSLNKTIVPENLSQVQKEMDKTKKELDKLKNFIVKKYPFTQSISILHSNAIPELIKEEEIPKETEKFMHLYMVIPEEQFKNIAKIRGDIVNQLEPIQKNVGQKIWLQVKTPVDIWETCLDSKFDILKEIAVSYPIYDKGFLGALRIAEIHKALVLQKFDKYVVSYVVAGSFLRGTATKTSDVDVFIIINDTDVKRMPRLELKERLRAMIHQYIAEAAALAGVKNTLHIQTYLLTEFWDSVKDANPVIFTFIRDGVPIYDKGTFLPWKALLRMGKLKPSPESIDMFMKSAEKTKEMVERRLIEAMIDVYYGVLTPSQALIMLNGSPPPTHKETPSLMDDIFVKKEKLLKKSEIEILDRAVKLFKKYEHDPKMKISGKEVDELVEASDKYFKRLKELRKQIEKRYNERTVEQLHKDVFNLLKIVVGKMSQEKTIEKFEKDFVKKGKFSQYNLRTLKNIVQVKKEFKKGKIDSHKINNARKDTTILINDLIDYSQRCDLASIEKGKIKVKYKKSGKEKTADLFMLNKKGFLIADSRILKLEDKVSESTMEELSEALEKQKDLKESNLNPKIFELIKKELGSFELIV